MHNHAGHDHGAIDAGHDGHDHGAHDGHDHAPAPAAPEATTAPLQWRDAHGNVVPECRVRGRC
jgi:hypothetical protein